MNDKIMKTLKILSLKLARWIASCNYKLMRKYSIKAFEEIKKYDNKAGWYKEYYGHYKGTNIEIETVETISKYGHAYNSKMAEFWCDIFHERLCKLEKAGKDVTEYDYKIKGGNYEGK
jgi:hypothetical protein